MHFTRLKVLHTSRQGTQHERASAASTLKFHVPRARLSVRAGRLHEQQHEIPSRGDALRKVSIRAQHQLSPGRFYCRAKEEADHVSPDKKQAKRAAKREEASDCYAET